MILMTNESIEKKRPRKGKKYVGLREHATPFGVLILDRLKERGTQLKVIAQQAETYTARLNRAIEGKTELNAVEIARICHFLDIPLEEYVQTIVPPGSDDSEFVEMVYIMNLYRHLKPDQQRLMRDTMVGFSLVNE
jgi:hypothetical protein